MRSDCMLAAILLYMGIMTLELVSQMVSRSARYERPAAFPRGISGSVPEEIIKVIRWAVFLVYYICLERPFLLLTEGALGC